MAYKDPNKIYVVPTPENPYREPDKSNPKDRNNEYGGYYFGAEQGVRVDPNRNLQKTTNTNTGGGGGGAAVQPAAGNTEVSTDPGYVAPSNKLTMPNSNPYDVAAPDAYQSRWQESIDNLMGQIMNRDKFTYDLDGDMLYQQYKNQYQLLGNQAMQDTMGQAAGLTGGYGSTYSQNAGQQAYNAYLQQLNDKVPELYGMALDQYNQEGANMRSNLAMLNQAEESDYGRYNDNYNKWLTERQHAEERDDLAWNREYQFQKDQYGRQQDEYNRIASLIGTYGYNPTDEELAAAGLSRSIADMMRNAYLAAQMPSGGGGGGRSGGGTEKTKQDQLDDSWAKWSQEQAAKQSAYMDSLASRPVKDSSGQYSDAAVTAALISGGMSNAAAQVLVKNNKAYALQKIGIK